MLSQRWLEDVIRGKKTGVLPASIRSLAHYSSRIYQLASEQYQLAYERKWLKTHELSRYTISIGNLTAGGTGKTPFVMHLANELLAHGVRPAILLRGYRRKKNQSKPVVVRDANKILANVTQCGDEAMELAVRTPGAIIGVGANRFQVGSSLLDRYPIDCFILDDGFQHRALSRDMDVVVVDATDPWGGGHLLPKGFLRERPSALCRADAVVISRSKFVSPDRLKVLRADIQEWAQKKLPIFECHSQPQELYDPIHQKSVRLAVLRKQPILAVSGIGRPELFEMTLKSLDMKVTHHVKFSDHGGTSDAVWKQVQQKTRSVKAVVLTEKDWVRWHSGNYSRIRPPIYVLRNNLLITAHKKEFDQWLRSCIAQTKIG